MTTTVRPPAFVAHAPEFDEITGDWPRLSVLAEVDAHEGPVYFTDEDELYFSSVPQPGPDRARLLITTDSAVWAAALAAKGA